MSEEILKRLKALEDSFARMQLRLALPANIQLHEYQDEFSVLKNLLHSSYWPNAVDPKLICAKEQEADKADRAEKILDYFIDAPLEGLKFLDFGCGEGHVIKNSLRQKPKLAFGYDIQEQSTWDNTGPARFSTEWAKVKEAGPYNVILLYDVVDHLRVPHVDQLTDKHIVDVFIELKKVLAPNGRIYLRCHPWCSRHATHLYHKINKAFAHLVFNDNELKEMGYETDSVVTVKIIHPITQYNAYFQGAGFNILRSHTIDEHIEPFFADVPLIAKRIKGNWVNSPDHRFRTGHVFPSQLKFQFIDYVIW